MTGPAIVFDGAVLDDGPPTGVARAFLTTLAAWLPLASARHWHPLLLLRDRQPAPHPAAVGLASAALEGLEVVRSPALRGGLPRLLRLGRTLRRLDAALLHSPVAALPLRADCPRIATIHDVPWQAEPPLHEPETQRLRDRLALRLAARCADVLVVPSQATADAVRRAVGGPPRATVEVIPHGVRPPTQPASPTERSGPFVAFGDQRPRKNLALLRRAHTRARTMRPDLPALVLVGPGLTWLEESAKQQLLRTARALLVPSLHEGFGLPLLEAFGHGLPAVCSARGSLPELAGDAASLVTENSEAAWSDAMIRIHDDEELRETLAARGAARARAFTPERSAERWLALHVRLLDDGGTA